jgi:protein BCP1
MLSPEDEAELASNPPPKKAKQSSAKPLLGNASGTGGIFSFHPEDECIQKAGVFDEVSRLVLLTSFQFASHTHDFRFTRAQPREKDAFGLDVRARMMVVPSENFTQMVQTMQAEFGVDQMETDQ